jgi:hypothetical protein
MFIAVMAWLVPAIHAVLRGTKTVDARDKPGHDGVCGALTSSFT